MAPAPDGKQLRSLQRKAKKLAKEEGKDETVVLAELLAEAGLGEAANGVVEAKTASKAASEGVREDDSRTVAAVLASHPLSRDIHIEQFTLLFHGHELLMDAKLELNHGRRYGLIGPNGCGKSTLLKSIAAREVPIPPHIDIYFLDREIHASDDTALDCVKSVDEAKIRLEKEAEELMEKELTSEIEMRLEDIYEQLDELGSDSTEARAASILHGLGFTPEMQNKKTREFSGGWRMRIALARALFVKPTLMLLDEPTNHLDLEACVWLENYLASYNKILLLISHSQDFMNGVCTNILHMQHKTLTNYTGNYDQYVTSRAQLEENQMKKYNWEQEQIKDMKEYIARFGHGSAKLARQAQSKEKTLAKMMAEGLTPKVEKEFTVNLKFEDVGKLPPPVLQFTDVAFGYSRDKILYRNVDLGVDLDSRIAIVGPNGAGKSTLLKLMTGDLEPVDGVVKRHNHLRIGMYHQHLTDQLNPQESALEYFMREFPNNSEDRYPTIAENVLLLQEKMRSAVGRFGVSGKNQTMRMFQLSDGLKSRVALAWLAYRQPHMLLLDEPTNHLDIETIDALASAIKKWDGGMVLVSHDFRLISQVANEIWEVKGGKVNIWQGDIISYKKYLKKQHGTRTDLS